MLRFQEEDKAAHDPGRCGSCGGPLEVIWDRDRRLTDPGILWTIQQTACRQCGNAVRPSVTLDALQTPEQVDVRRLSEVSRAGMTATQGAPRRDSTEGHAG